MNDTKDELLVTVSVPLAGIRLQVERAVAEYLSPNTGYGRAPCDIVKDACRKALAEIDLSRMVAAAIPAILDAIIADEAAKEARRIARRERERRLAELAAADAAAGRLFKSGENS